MKLPVPAKTIIQTSAIIPMKTAPASRVFAAALALAGILVPPALRAQDLPYTSGSTGADGALTIPTIFPNVGPRGGAVYHEAEGAVYYISSYFVWKSTDGVAWTRLPDLPNQWAVDPASGQLCFDSVNGILYAFALRGDTTSAQLYKLVGGNWQAAGDPMPSYDGGPGNWNTGRLVFHVANGTLVYYGGGNYRHETWTFDGTAWTQASPANVPPSRSNPQMAYDPLRQETVLFGGDSYADTWVWNGSNWISKTSPLNPPAMNNYGAVWHPGFQGVVIPTTGREIWVWDGSVWRLEHTTGLGVDSKAGFAVAYLGASSEMLAIINNQVISLKNQIWSQKAGNPYYIDLNTKPNGVFNYTDITVPYGMTIKFHRNAANTPVIWLATGNVTINGTVDVSASGYSSGPGGYDGASGLMVFGNGPGGGIPTAQMGGRYYGVYGNPQIEPLVGGSGGGRPDNGQVPGGGGGGALLIAASRDIHVSGTLASDGGNAGEWVEGYYTNLNRNMYGYHWSGIFTGSGAGGAIKLVADRVLGNGSLHTNAGGAQSGDDYYSNQVGSPGRIRVEAYQSEIGPNSSPQAWISYSPVWTSAAIPGQSEYELKVTHVAGAEVRQPATGASSPPDVFFNSDQPVTVVVSGRNIPDGTPIKLNIGGSGINTTLPPSGDPPVTMQSGGATFTATIPTGTGGIQAYAQFQKPETP